MERAVPVGPPRDSCNLCRWHSFIHGRRRARKWWPPPTNGDMEIGNMGNHSHSFPCTIICSLEK